ncbi:MAG: cupredoxin family copper-binding protein, partial [Actinobacteria bacterium]|nr:cupredoxin family copper-binding protein [Actinomycetota bacterium]MCL6087976.1 cupredoxin family copper-binding protein [Actinomycetota bacterium]
MKRNKIILYLCIIVSAVLAVFLSVSCTGYGQTSGTTTSTEVTETTGAAVKNEVLIQGNAFVPDTLNAKVGDTVTWINKDSYDHTATSSTGEFDSGNMPSGGKYSFTFSKEGTFEYICSIHTFMKGKIVVTK